jgi:two-component system CheB/CheR fusion protein
MLNKAISLNKKDGLTGKRLVIVVDDDAFVSAGMVTMLEDAGFCAKSYGSAEELFDTDWADHAVCLLLDESLPGMCGVDALKRISADGTRVPVVMITGTGDVPKAVAAMKAGACDFIEKPASEKEILAAIDRALALCNDGVALDGLHAKAAHFTAQLTPRQRQIVDMIIAGCANKVIASDLGISQRTVENHRAEIMRKSGVKSLPALTRMMFVSSLPIQHTAALAPTLIAGGARLSNGVARNRLA